MSALVACKEVCKTLLGAKSVGVTSNVPFGFPSSTFEFSNCFSHSLVRITASWVPKLPSCHSLKSLADPRPAAFPDRSHKVFPIGDKLEIIHFKQVQILQMEQPSRVILYKFWSLCPRQRCLCMRYRCQAD